MRTIKKSVQYILSIISIGILALYYLFHMNILFAYIVMVGTVYGTYVLKSILELIIIKVLNIVEIKYFVIYPFSYDGVIHFNPIVLLYNNEGLQDNVYLNIPYTLSDEEAYTLYKQLLYTAKSSLCISAFIIGIIMQFYTDYWIIIILGVCSILWVAFSFFKTTAFFYGPDYIIRKYGLKGFLLQGNGYREYVLSFYEEYFDSSPIIDDELLLKILENYIYLVIQNDIVLTKDQVNRVMEVLEVLEHHYYEVSFAPVYHILFHNLLKIFVLYFHHYGDNESINKINNFLVKYRDKLVVENEIGFLNPAIGLMNEYFMDETVVSNRFMKKIVLNNRPIYPYSKKN